MRRLLALPLAAASIALAVPSAPAQAVPCYPDKSLSYAGVCAGIVCEDFCAPIVVVDPYCELDRPPTALCVLVDGLYFRSDQLGG